MANIYYVGDWAVMCGPVFAETPFNYAYKGLELYNYGHWLKDALESTGEHRVTSVPTWDFYKLPPGRYEQILDEYDVIVFSDVEAKNFQLAPSFFDRQKFGQAILTFPDRIRLTVEAVEAGKAVMFLGGWLSFSGEMGKGGWNRTRLREILPVRCLDFEDLVESTEGFTAERSADDRDFPAGISLADFPPILGYNKTLPRDSCPVLLRVKETGHPLVAVGAFGRGRTLAYTSDPAPHWGCNFVFWQHYAAFWLACLDQVLGGSSSRT
ncbi:MAG: hypothetical protein JSW55_19780 [Chloroflexota bacterium]|nr:MAG: hypothetical protein JSW55_19780 [Chloroflexota bacterium]